MIVNQIDVEATGEGTTRVSLAGSVELTLGFDGLNDLPLEVELLSYISHFFGLPLLGSGCDWEAHDVH